jgi:Fe-S-cluster containining protein
LARRALPVVSEPPSPAPNLEGTEHLGFVCNGCGDCCRSHRVALTHLDLARLVAALGVPAASLVEWLGPEAVDLAAESAGMVTLPGGPRLMVLAHDAGACRLLDAEQRCQAYGARPQDCRVYPFVLERDPAGRAARLTLFEAEACGDRAEPSVELSEVDRADRQRWAELAEYRTHVARWNHLARQRDRLRHRAHGERDFLAFLAARAVAVTLLALAGLLFAGCERRTAEKGGPSPVASAATAATAATATSPKAPRATPGSTAADDAVIPATFATLRFVLTGTMPPCNAADCHGPGGPNRLQYPVRDPERLYEVLTHHVSVDCGNIPVVTPGDPQKSALMKVLKGPCSAKVPQMPNGCRPEQGNCVPSNYVAAIERWITLGAPKD